MISVSVVKELKTAGGQCITLVNGIMNSENVLNEMVKSFNDLANMAKGLVDKNQQPLSQQQLEKLFPQYKRWKEGR